MPTQRTVKNIDARSGAYEILRRVEQGGYADRLLDSYLQRHPAMDAREKGLLTELVYGSLRLRGRLDFALSRFSRQPLQKLDHPHPALVVAAQGYPPSRIRAALIEQLEITDTGVFEPGYVDVTAEYAKGSPNDILVRITVASRSAEAADLHLHRFVAIGRQSQTQQYDPQQAGAGSGAASAHG